MLVRIDGAVNMRVEINIKGSKELADALKHIGKVGFKHAVKGTLNSAAFDTRAAIQAEMKRDFTLRNKFTVNSVQVDKVKTQTVNRMESTVGSVAHYMADVEQGGVRKNRAGGLSTWVTSSFASGEEGAAKRLKVPKRQHLIKNLKVNKTSVTMREGGKGGLAVPTRRNKQGRVSVKYKNLSGLVNKGHANRMLIESVAKQTSSKYVALDTARGKGIYKVINDGGIIRVKLMYDLSKPQINIKSNPMFKPNAHRVAMTLPAIYEKEIKRQLARKVG